MACGGCKGAPIMEGDAEMAHYCSSGCQQANWTQHKPQCQRLQDRKTLYRIAATAQMFFYVYRELTLCEFDIKDVETDGEDLRLRGNVQTSSLCIILMRSMSILTIVRLIRSAEMLLDPEPINLFLPTLSR
jgi:hypothetical protein